MQELLHTLKARTVTSSSLCYTTIYCEGLKGRYGS